MKIGNLKIASHGKVRLQPVIKFLKKTKEKSKSLKFLDYYWGG